MSFGERLKERRKQLGITQVELANMLGITKGAIGNYESELSSPKAEILYRVFDVLQCDANFLFQDEMKSLNKKTPPAPEEPETGDAVEDNESFELFYRFLLSRGFQEDHLSVAQRKVLASVADILDVVFPQQGEVDNDDFSGLTG